MKPFVHYNAKTIREAVKWLQDSKGKAKLIAGGTDLLGILKDRILPDYPEVVINIKTVSGLEYIQEGDERIKIGALTRLADIADSPVVKGKYRLLAEAAEAVAAPQIRNVGTIAGNLCQDLRCWYYRYPHDIGARFVCHVKGGKTCYALTGENQSHSIFGGFRTHGPPCSCGCPGAVDIPSYLSMIREGDLGGAAELLLAANPIPSVTGRVCPHFCEQECNREGFDESVSIREIERFMGDYVLENFKEMITFPEVETGRRVAIVGAGPAGLSAAYHLRRSGHRITVFDRMKEPGGMLAYGIPMYRLPREIVKRVIGMFEHLGIEFRLNVEVGRDLTFEDLKRDFDSIFLASGAWRTQAIGLKGEEFTQSGLEFLTRVNSGVKEPPGERVLVIGGGNVAVDVARTALRLGSKEVSIAYRRSKEEMPACRDEIEFAGEEGIRFYFLSTPVRIVEKNGKVAGLECIRTDLGEPDESSRRRPVPIKDSEFVIDADTVISAIGEEPDLSFLGAMNFNITSHRTLEVDPKTLATNHEGIFAGGDVTRGPSTVIEAIAAGKKAAAAIDSYLQGTGIHAQGFDERKSKAFLRFNVGCLKRTPRAMIPKSLTSERKVEVDEGPVRGLSEVEREANRCFNCGCVAVNTSDIAVALVALDATIKIEGPRGFRIIPVDDFFCPGGTRLGPDEIVTEIEIPKPPDRAKQTFLKFRVREAIDFSIVSVASVIFSSEGVWKSARIALGGVAPRPIRAMMAEQAIKGKAIETATAEEAAAVEVASAIPLAMNRNKVEIIRTMVKRALLSTGEGQDGFPPRREGTF